MPETQGRIESREELLRRRPVSALIGTWFGAGFLPMVPGTWGSLAALPFIELSFRVGGVAGLVAFAAAASVGGIFAAGRVADAVGRKDPSIVVVDEVAGQALTLVPVYALLAGRSPVLFWTAVLGGFFLFRVLDVVKPGPVRKLESLPGGLGIMADDVLAGLIGAVVMAALSVLALKMR